MNKAKLKGNWNVQKGKFKKPFVVVTENDLMFREGHVDVLRGKLHQKPDKSEEAPEKIKGR